MIATSSATSTEVSIQEIPLRLENLGPVDRRQILHQLISFVKQKYSDRYAELFESEDVSSLLEQELNPTVRAICNDGNFTLFGYVDIQLPYEHRSNGLKD